jgi:hypothetical protein
VRRTTPSLNRWFHRNRKESTLRAARIRKRRLTGCAGTSSQRPVLDLGDIANGSGSPAHASVRIPVVPSEYACAYRKPQTVFRAGTRPRPVGSLERAAFSYQFGYQLAHGTGQKF